MIFQNNTYTLNQITTDLFEFINNSKPLQYTNYYDKLIFHTPNNKFIACYKDNLYNYWEI